MRIEAFSRGKRHDRPEENEDSLLLLPGIAYAVLDGVTDRTARRYGGERAGRHASRTVAARLAGALPGIAHAGEEPKERATAVVAAAVDAIAATYRAHGLFEDAEADPPTRMGCTLAVGLEHRDGLTVVAVGDSGIRVTRRDGTVALLEEDKALDTVTALMRREAWRWAIAAGADAEAVRTLSDSVVWSGFGSPHPGLDEAATERLRGRALEACRAAVPQAPESELDYLLDTGIFGQRAFANHPDLTLGYGVLDGFAVPERYVQVAHFGRDEVARLEIHSDGYFDPPAGFGVEAWEAAFRAVEREDPDKVGRHASTKGSTASAWTDDRTYLGVDFTAGDPG